MKKNRGKLMDAAADLRLALETLDGLEQLAIVRKFLGAQVGDLEQAARTYEHERLSEAVEEVGALAEEIAEGQELVDYRAESTLLKHVKSYAEEQAVRARIKFSSDTWAKVREVLKLKGWPECALDEACEIAIDNAGQEADEREGDRERARAAKLNQAPAAAKVPEWIRGEQILAGASPSSEREASLFELLHTVVVADGVASIGVDAWERIRAKIVAVESAGAGGRTLVICHGCPDANVEGLHTDPRGFPGKLCDNCADVAAHDVKTGHAELGPNASDAAKAKAAEVAAAYQKEQEFRKSDAAKADALRPEFVSELRAFVAAARDLSRAWGNAPGDLGVKGYPACLPDFEEFLLSLIEWRDAQAEILERTTKPPPSAPDTGAQS